MPAKVRTKARKGPGPTGTYLSIATEKREIGLKKMDDPTDKRNSDETKPLRERLGAVVV